MDASECFENRFTEFIVRSSLVTAGVGGLRDNGQCRKTGTCPMTDSFTLATFFVEEVPDFFPSLARTCQNSIGRSPGVSSVLRASFEALNEATFTSRGSARGEYAAQTT